MTYKKRNAIVGTVVVLSFCEVLLVKEPAVTAVHLPQLNTSRVNISFPTICVLTKAEYIDHCLIFAYKVQKQNLALKNKLFVIKQYRVNDFIHTHKLVIVHARVVQIVKSALVL